MLDSPSCILVMSRDATSLQGLTRALRHQALPVTPAYGWDDCEARLRSIPVSLVVADVEVLGREELGTLQRLQEKFPHVSVIALVSLVTADARAAAAEGLVAVILQKPVGLVQLDEAVSSTTFRKIAP
jgi:DNA-binding NtrC family response regulator